MSNPNYIPAEKYLSDPSDVDYVEDDTSEEIEQQIEQIEQQIEHAPIKHKNVLVRTEPVRVFFGVGELSQTMSTKQKLGKIRKYRGTSITPNDISVSILDKELKSYNEITSDLREEWRNEMKDLPQIQYLNKKSLAAALVLLHFYRIKSIDQLSPETFKEMVYESVLDKLLPEGSPQDTVLALSHVATLLRYSRAVLKYRTGMFE